MPDENNITGQIGRLETAQQQLADEVAALSATVSELDELVRSRLQSEAA